VHQVQELRGVPKHHYGDAFAYVYFNGENIRGDSRRLRASAQRAHGPIVNSERHDVKTGNKKPNAEQWEAVIAERDELRSKLQAAAVLLKHNEEVAAEAVAVVMIKLEHLEMNSAIMRDCLERLRVAAILKKVSRKEIMAEWPAKIEVATSHNAGMVGLAILESGINFRHAYGAAGDLDGTKERKLFRVFATQIDEYELLEQDPEVPDV
jgi:hypothetical protein